MSKITLKDFLPLDAEFKLSATGKTYCLRAMTLGDGAWYQKTFGVTPEKVLQNGEYNELCKCIYYQLKDKSDFLGEKEAKLIDDEGFEVIKKITGPEKLMKVVNLQEIDAIISAFMTCMGVKQEHIDEIIKESKDKKKQKNLKKKKPTKKTGKK